MCFYPAPASRFSRGAVAQLEERRPREPVVPGSNPGGSTTSTPHNSYTYGRQTRLDKFLVASKLVAKLERVVNDLRELYAALGELSYDDREGYITAAWQLVERALPEAEEALETLRAYLRA